MWQIICVCLSTTTTREQQHFFHLWCRAEHASAEERGAVDLGLLFLHALSAEKVLTVLEEPTGCATRFSLQLSRSHPQRGRDDILSGGDALTIEQGESYDANFLQ